MPALSWCDCHGYAAPQGMQAGFWGWKSEDCVRYITSANASKGGMPWGEFWRSGYILTPGPETGQGLWGNAVLAVLNIKNNIAFLNLIHKKKANYEIRICLVSHRGWSIP